MLERAKNPGTGVLGRPSLTEAELIRRHIDVTGRTPMIAETGYSVPSVVSWLVRCGWDVGTVKEILLDLSPDQIKAAAAYACRNPGNGAVSIARRHWLARVAQTAFPANS